MKHKNLFRWIIPVVLLLSVVLVGCGSLADIDPQSIATVPFGEPDFPNLGDYWVIEVDEYLTDDTVSDVDRQLEHTRSAGFAEQAIIVMDGINEPRNYAVQVLRHLKLGEPDGERKDNGVVWLVMPDREPGDQIWYAIGTGLPEFTSFEAGAVKDAAAVYAESGDWNAVILEIAAVSDAQLREVYPELAVETEPLEDEVEISPEAVMWALIVLAIIILVGIGLYAIDPELGELWFHFWFLIFRVLAAGAGGGRSGSGSGSGSRSG